MIVGEAMRPCLICGQHPKFGFNGNEDGGYGYVECSGPDGHFIGFHCDDEATARARWNAAMSPPLSISLDREEEVG